MFCKYCGKDIGENTLCPYCGRNNEEQANAVPQATGYVYNNPILDPGKGKATASLVCGILSLFFIGGLVTSILAIVFAGQYFKKGNGSNAGAAKAGRITGIIGTVLNGVAILALIVTILLYMGIAFWAVTSHYFHM